MPRASFEQVLQALFHDEPEIRDLARTYLTDVPLADPVVMLKLGETFDRFGFEDRRRFLIPMARLPQSAASIDWVLKWLLQTTPTGKFEYVHPLLVNLLVHADPRLVAARKADIARVVGITPASRELLDRQARMIDRSEAELWQDLDAFCESWKSVAFTQKVPYAQGEILIAELARRGAAFPKASLPKLQDTREDPLGDPDYWRVPLLVQLAGLLQHEPAIPYLTANLDSESDILTELSAKALGAIGTEAVRTAVRAAFDRENLRTTIYFTSVIEHWHSDSAVELGIELMQAEKDASNKDFHAMALSKQLSTEANEAIAREFGVDLDYGEFGESIYWSCRLLGQEIPGLRELEAWIQDRDKRHAALQAEHDKYFGTQTQPRKKTALPKPILKPAPSAKKSPGRNDICPCGSGKKFKKCCLLKK